MSDEARMPVVIVTLAAPRAFPTSWCFAGDFLAAASPSPSVTAWSSSTRALLVTIASSSSDMPSSSSSSAALARPVADLAPDDVVEAADGEDAGSEAQSPATRMHSRIILTDLDLIEPAYSNKCRHNKR